MPAEDFRGDTPEEEALSVAETATAELRALKERLSVVTRHSFRTPLTVIDGNARRLARHAENFSPDEVKTRTETIRSTVEKMVELVEHTIELTDLAACVREYPPATSPLGDLISLIIEERELLQPGRSNVTWINECPDIEVTDRRLVELLVDKLLTIGTDLVDSRGRLDLFCWREGNWANLSLKAVFGVSGLVDVKNLSSKLEERSEERDTILNEGLNLKLIRLLVEQHGGELELEHCDDRIEFELCLPIGAPDQFPANLLVNPNPNTIPSSTENGVQS